MWLASNSLCKYFYYNAWLLFKGFRGLTSTTLSRERIILHSINKQLGNRHVWTDKHSFSGVCSCSK